MVHLPAAVAALFVLSGIVAALWVGLEVRDTFWPVKTYAEGDVEVRYSWGRTRIGFGGPASGVSIFSRRKGLFVGYFGLLTPTDAATVMEKIRRHAEQLRNFDGRGGIDLSDGPFWFVARGGRARRIVSEIVITTIRPRSAALIELERQLRELLVVRRQRAH